MHLWSKTLQSPSLVLVKTRKEMNNVSCRRDMSEILLKAAYNTIQSINHKMFVEKISIHVVLWLEQDSYMYLKKMPHSEQ